MAVKLDHDWSMHSLISQVLKYHAGVGVKGDMGKRIPKCISKPMFKTNQNGQLEKDRPGCLAWNMTKYLRLDVV